MGYALEKTIVLNYDDVWHYIEDCLETESASDIENMFKLVKQVYEDKFGKPDNSMEMEQVKQFISECPRDQLMEINNEVYKYYFPREHGLVK